MTHRYTYFFQRSLERKRAAECESHQIVGPILQDVLWGVGQPAISIYVVSRNVGTDVDIHSEACQERVTGITNIDKRTGHRVFRQ